MRVVCLGSVFVCASFGLGRGWRGASWNRPVSTGVFTESGSRGGYYTVLAAYNVGL